MLVSKGLARIKGVSVNGPSGEKSKTRLDKLRQLEDEAKAGRVGVWAHSVQSEGDKPAK